MFERSSAELRPVNCIKPSAGASSCLLFKMVSHALSLAE